MPIHDHDPNIWGRSFLWGGLALGVLCVALALTHGFGFFKEAAPPPEDEMVQHRGSAIFIPEHSPLRQRLKVEVAKSEAVSDTRAFPGIVESNPALTAAVLTPLAGRVVEIRAALGDRVRKGQILAILDSADLGQAYDDNQKASDAAHLAARNLARQEEQFKLGTLSGHDLDQARSDAAQTNAEYERTRARLRILEVPETVPSSATRLRITAPVAGSVTALNIATGNMINDPTQPIMTVADLSTVWVTALVPEKDVHFLNRGAQASVTLDAYPGRVLHGTVQFVSDVIDTDSRRDRVRIAFANDDLALKPNMFATVTLSGAPASERVVVPSSALLVNNDRTSVFVATAPWTFERRTVAAALEEGPNIALDTGVKAGESVIVTGAILLND